eukprot:TRINITY_DN1222_c0_g1_i3.p1 TRINITY_DN1222_c0_g1~~TRINITY_DN1222_c0_g1_i3.p1  ORF type:complete len:158 (-),score=53.72 TRINITY_DN1222_c0_g1_i3:18-491(-)
MGKFLVLLLILISCESRYHKRRVEHSDSQNEDGAVFGIPNVFIHSVGKTNAEKDEGFVDQFKTYMTDMKPEDVINFELPAGEKKIFVEKVDIVPITLKGAYTVSASQWNKVTLTIMAPNLTIISASKQKKDAMFLFCLLYTSPSPRDQRGSRMPSSA